MDRAATSAEYQDYLAELAAAVGLEPVTIEDVHSEDGYEQHGAPPPKSDGA